MYAGLTLAARPTCVGFGWAVLIKAVKRRVLLTFSELARTFGVEHPDSIAMAIRRYKDALAKNPRERRMMETKPKS